MSLVKEGGVPSPVDNFARAVFVIGQRSITIPASPGEGSPQRRDLIIY
jgi:hypothetical protein